MKNYALVTKENTAIAESTLCGNHFSVLHMAYAIREVKDNKDLNFVDVSDNDECDCIFCPAKP